MFTRSHAEKAVQAAAVLLRASHNRDMESVRLLKLLYIADRVSWKQSGRPILGNDSVAMDHGPLHRDVYDLIQGQHAFEDIWSGAITKCGYALTLTNDPGVLALSKKEIGILNAVSDQFRNESTWDLVELTRQFSEWKSNYIEGTSARIPTADILDGVGIAPEEKTAMLADFAEAQQSDKLFGQHPLVAS